MIADTIDALRVLAGDALIAAGELIRGGSDDIDIWPADFEPAAMECDGPDSTKPIPLDEIRSALNDLPDSVLIRAAAAVIRQSSYSGMPNPLSEALRALAARFETAELAAGRPPFPFPPAWATHQTDSSRRGE